MSKPKSKDLENINSKTYWNYSGGRMYIPKEKLEKSKKAALDELLKDLRNSKPSKSVWDVLKQLDKKSK